MDTKQMAQAISPLAQQVAEKCKPLEIGNLQLAEKVLQGKKISDATDSEIKAKLLIIYVMIGLRQQHVPDEEEKLFLLEYIRLRYANKTLDELVLAFDLAIQGQLEIDDAKVYDQFSCEYLAKIMNAYRLWLNAVLKNANTFKKPPMQLDEKKHLTKQEWDEWIKDIRTYPFDLIPCHLYEYYEREGIINLTNDQKHALMDKAILYLAAKLEGKELAEFLPMKKIGVFSGVFPAALKTIAKRMAVKNYFDETNV